MLERIERSFGSRVATIVEALSDTIDGDSQEPWGDRKRRYLEHLQEVTDEGVLRVALADKVHNARSLVRDYRVEGRRLVELAHAESGPDGSDPPGLISGTGYPSSSGPSSK